jgi:hypothetical protein
LNNQDCTSCRGSGYTCDLVSNTCKSSTPPPPPPPPPGTIQYGMWLFPYRYLPWQGHYVGGLGNEFENPQYLIDNLKGMNIDVLIIAGGTWKSDGTIRYDVLDKTGTYNEEVIVAKWKNLITEVKKVYPNMKFLTWVLSSGLPYGGPDLRDSATRAKMIESALALINRVGLDGWNEDYEGWGWYKNNDGEVVYDSSRLVYLKTYYQELATVMKNNGKITIVATEVNWGGYSVDDYDYILNSDIDYVAPMYYGNVKYKSTILWNKILQNSPCPVLMGISVWNGVFDKETWTYEITFDEQLDWFDTQSKTNLAGYSIWCYDHMSYEDMDTWRAWVNK